MCVADLHFSHTPPPIWFGQDWYGVMKRYIKQLIDLAYELNPDFGLPIIAAGDITNHWKEPPELVNFLIKEMPFMIAVAGNHDLPYHNYEDRNKSVFQTLVAAGKLELIHPDKPLMTHTLMNSQKKLALYGFPCGTEVTPLPDNHPDGDEWLHVAVVHDYIWTKKTGYKDAPTEKRVARYGRRLRGYNAAIFGDNHKGFLIQSDVCSILNAGCFIRRRSDELSCKPSVGLLHEDGTFSRHRLDTSDDKFLDIEGLSAESGHSGVELEDLLSTVLSLGEAGVNFIDAVQHCIKRKKITGVVRDIMLRCLEKKRGE